MGEFVYKILDKNGKLTKGTIMAEDINAALKILKSREVFVIDLQEKGLLEKEVNLRVKRRISTKELFIFCRQFATMLMAGISVLNCLDVLRTQNRGKYFGKVLNDLYEEVSKGNPLSSAMHEHRDIFPSILIHMVEAGELSGSLDTAMDKMAIHFEKEMKLKQKIVNALIYPVIVISVASLVFLFLLTFVIPAFVGIFAQLNVQLPSITLFIINLGVFLKRNIIYILSAIVLGYIGYKMFRKFQRGAVFIDSFKLKIPLIKNIILGQATSRFTRTLATLLGAGVNLLTALDTTKRVISNAYIEKAFEGVIERVRGGEGLSQPISELKIFPPLVSIMLRTGEETGRLEYMLEKAADFYENEVENQITRLTALFEPLMIIFLALMVGFLVISIILPLFRLYGSVNI